VAVGAPAVERLQREVGEGPAAAAASAAAEEEHGGDSRSSLSRTVPLLLPLLLLRLLLQLQLQVLPRSPCRSRSRLHPT